MCCGVLEAGAEFDSPPAEVVAQLEQFRSSLEESLGVGGTSYNKDQIRASVQGPCSKTAYIFKN